MDPPQGAPVGDVPPPPPDVFAQVWNPEPDWPNDDEPEVVIDPQPLPVPLPPVPQRDTDSDPEPDPEPAPEPDPEPAPAAAPTKDAEAQWTLPAASDAVNVQDGIYRGRPQAGEAGAMLRVLPSVRSKFGGTHVPDSTVDVGVVSDAVSVGVVSIKGASHHLSGVPRQDAYAIVTDENWLVVGLADGVSEGRLSHVAATEAARAAANEALQALVGTAPENVDWSSIGIKARDTVRAAGQRRAKVQVADGDAVPEVSDRTIARIMATTCDLLVVPLDRKLGELRVWRIRIAGDGSFYVLDPGRGWGVIDTGKSTTSATIDNSLGDPLPIGGEDPTVESWLLEPGQAAVLCTDGFGDVIGAGALPVGRFLFGAWQQPLDTSRLLYTASFVNTNADDDRTAAIVWATA